MYRGPLAPTGREAEGELGGGQRHAGANISPTDTPQAGNSPAGAERPLLFPFSHFSCLGLRFPTAS